ncbi:YsnF/AvaK domain-containing protein [Aureimonas glaciei]|uniref:DUF2382 domain-containing protein n=1 Tax=Aureimonas glaciei TaxID=1776957 RepID=A0A916Y4X6_9HYPH|nr:YsnF/AvaK domain-containing protein [Aureimonas glaciei]GGD31373.1 hypothetical protein GCM10011335_38020 [Aureimonas glaciei]
MSREEDQTGVIPLVEETARIEKEEVVTGRVRVRTVTEETDHVIGQDLDTENVEISRVTLNREVAEAPAIRQEGDVTIISLVEEIIVVTKKLVVTEEIHVRRIRSTEHVETSINLRKQTAVVERTDAEDDSSSITSTGDQL